ncbi:Ferredoxin-type protein NapF [Vibrio stylophorae]|uniref:Ferredoxin-type protein NapF n=1 Tax=Vibrio stylophorae TaxID=659351 RepID=A0ABM8ZSJ7_9VIBR|nr:Ferredoxin-type protein NapF [Vibrio stylophorae]
MVDHQKRRLLKLNSQPKHWLPWLISEQSLTDGCTQCGACLRACETQMIIRGDGGFPTVDFNLAECTFCYQCATHCPEPLFQEQQHPPWQLKVAIDASCLAYHNVECRSCADSCEAIAIRFRPSLGKTAQPLLDLDACTGCGACQSVCPVSAIQMHQPPSPPQNQSNASKHSTQHLEIETPQDRAFNLGEAP